MQFISLADFTGTKNAVRISDAFVETLDLVNLGILSISATKQQPKKSKPGGAQSRMDGTNAGLNRSFVALHFV